MVREVIMQEGYLFFGFMWLGCWYLFFISNDTSEIRRWGLIRLLLGICCAGLLVPLMYLQINLLFVVAGLWSIYQYRNWSTIQTIKGTLVTICIAIALVCIRICSLLYPVWFVINWIYIAAIVLACLIVSLMHAGKRLNTLTLGIIIGETIYSGILYMYGFPIRIIGSWESLDLIVLTLTIVVVYNKAEGRWAKRMPTRKVYPSPQLGVKGK